jgi:hypothetical protein
MANKEGDLSMNSERNDLTMLSDVSRSVDQLCAQMSISNLKITPMNTFSDVNDFMIEFELVTTGLTEDQKIILLAKAFPPGRYRSWYETDLKPILKSGCSWRIAKRTILDRFSDIEQKDRHIAKLKNLKFDPDASQSLLEFVDDMAYSYHKALPDDKDPETLVRLVKASIPKQVRANLDVYQEFRDGKTVEALKKAAKQYDINRVGSSKQKPADTGALLNLTKAIQSLVEGVKKDNEATREAIVAAFNSKMDRQSRSISRERYPASASPRRTERGQNYLEKHQNNTNNQSQYNRDRSKTPPKFYPSKDTSDGPNQDSIAFDSNKYWELHRKPPSPCMNCGLWHWVRHCPQTLN